MSKKRIVSVIGLGYVGLPLAVEFAQKFKTIGFDINKKRLENLREGVDTTGELESKKIKSGDITFTDDVNILKEANFHVIAVPTPITQSKQPDLTPMIKASLSVGEVLKKGDIVVYESTVYPGVTEDECIPILEKVSKLKCGEDFKVGYSPERINPGDKNRTLKEIIKVVAACDGEALVDVAKTYEAIIDAGVHKASSIKVAESAKVIENTQRDLNIALMNELAIIFDRMGIDTNEVIEAAGTKWNFLKFKPGLVGGHCIGVDPYYLTHKAEMLGYHPQVILAGRRINDGMGKYIASQTVKAMIHAGEPVANSLITVMGLTFKENCSDIRNSKTIDVIEELKEFGVSVQVHDPLADKDEAKAVYGIDLVDFEKLKPSSAVVVAVAHDFYKSLDLDDLKRIANGNSCLIDVKSMYNAAVLKEAGFKFWRL